MRDLIKKVLKEARVPRSERVKLYKDKNIIVVVPLTHKALQKYAHECQWCINSDKGEWEDYHKGKHVIIIQRNPKKMRIGMTGMPTASEILMYSRWGEGYHLDDIEDILGYEFEDDEEAEKYLSSLIQDINNFATNIVYYSSEGSIYDMEDTRMSDFGYDISEIPNVTPEVIDIIEDYLQNQEVVTESEEGFGWVGDMSFDEGGVDKNVMDYLVKNYPKRTHNTKHYYDTEKDIDFILIDDKAYYLDWDSKKTMLNKIYWEIIDEFQNIDKGVLRRTIRQYINSLI